MTALEQLVSLLRHWDKHNRETFCGIRVHEALQELEELLPGAKCGDCALRVESGELAGECHFGKGTRGDDEALSNFLV